MWTTLRGLRRDPRRVQELVVRRYWQPVYDFACQQGLRHEDAEDVAQGVFMHICRDEFLKRADRAKGRFRSLLLAVTRHVIASFRRRELAGVRDRRREVPLEDFDLTADPDPDAEFDRLWVRNLVAQALDRLKDDATLPALRLQLGGKSYREIAEALGKPETAVTNHVHRAKQRLRAEITRLIEEYSTRQEAPGEIEALLKLI